MINFIQWLYMRDYGESISDKRIINAWKDYKEL